jgi:polyhydroxybutyrate depolymerase
MPRRRSTRTHGAVVSALVCALVAGVLAGCVVETSPSDRPAGTADDRSAITVDGVERTYLLRAPEIVPAQADAPADHAADPIPVLIAFHGVGSDAAEFEEFTQLTDSVDADRVMVVYPDGLPVPDGRRVWNAGDCCNAERTQPADDIGFLSALIEELSTRGADPTRIYLAGFSNGGMFAYRAACELGESIAGIAVVAGALTVDTVHSCPSATPVPLVVVHGTDDTIVPFSGGPLSAPVQAGMEQVRFASVAEAVRLWRRHNGCSADAQLSMMGEVNIARYAECSAGGAISTYTLAGGGHSWQTVDRTFDSSAVIVDAFGL